MGLWLSRAQELSQLPSSTPKSTSIKKPTIYDVIYYQHCLEAEEEETEEQIKDMIASRDYCRAMAEKRLYKRGWIER